MKIKNFELLMIGLNLFVYFLLISSCFKIKKSDMAEERLTLYAAAGSRIVTDEICSLFEERNNVEVARNYASSGTLARQIANGADTDLYLSANKQWIDYLVSKQLLLKNSICQIAGNRLVVVAPLNYSGVVPQFKKGFDIHSAISHKIVVGDPAYVPVGKYAKVVFDQFNWFDIIQDKIIMAKDVTSVLHYVELGECDWGIVYYTEAVQSQKVKIITEISEELHSPIVFYAALLNDNKTTMDFLDLFIQELGQAIFSQYGFTPFGQEKELVNDN